MIINRRFKFALHGKNIQHTCSEIELTYCCYQPNILFYTVHYYHAGKLLILSKRGNKVTVESITVMSAEIFLTGHHWVHISLYTTAKKLGQLWMNVVVRVSALFRCREI